jgi:hypothetical protein
MVEEAQIRQSVERVRRFPVSFVTFLSTLITANGGMVLRHRCSRPSSISVSRTTVSRGRGRPCGRPPRRSQRAGLPHWAPVMGTWRRTALRAKGA